MITYKSPHSGSSGSIFQNTASYNSKENNETDGHKTGQSPRAKVLDPIGQSKRVLEEAAGIDLSEVEINTNSPEPAKYGVEAFTDGKAVHISNTAKNPEKIIAHELAHLAQQQCGEVPAQYMVGGKSFNSDPKLEQNANEIAEEASKKSGHSDPQKIKNLLGVNNTSPSHTDNQSVIQCWGIGGVLARGMALYESGTLGELAGEHEIFTETATRQVNSRLPTNMAFSDDAIAKLKIGSIFNDILGQSGLGFVTQYLFSLNELINQSQGGSLLVLHAMGPYDQILQNRDKMMQWLNFCLCGYFNADTLISPGQTGKFQEIDLMTFIKLNKENISLLEMFIPLIIKKGKLEEIHNSLISSSEQYNSLTKQEKTIFLMNKVIEFLSSLGFMPNPDYCTEYALMTIGEFFGLGYITRINASSDVSFIALGALLHTVQDSFARSHCSRGYDPRFSGIADQEMDFTNSDSILQYITPIVSTLDPDYQKEHYKGDYLPHSLLGLWFNQQKRINSSEGGKKAQVVTAAILHMIAAGKKAEEILKFLNLVMRIDENTILLKRLESLTDSAQIQSLLKGTELEGIMVRTSLPEGSRAYSAYTIGQDETRNSRAYILGKAYTNDLKANEIGNRTIAPEIRLNQFIAQIRTLEAILNVAQNPRTKQEIKKHITEILLNLISFIKLSTDSILSAVAKTLKTECIRLINSIN